MPSVSIILNHVSVTKYLRIGILPKGIHSIPWLSDGFALYYLYFRIQVKRSNYSLGLCQICCEGITYLAIKHIIVLNVFTWKYRFYFCSHILTKKSRANLKIMEMGGIILPYFWAL